MNSKLPYEKLGLFYLGKELGIGSQASGAIPLLFKSKDLTTHGVIIGMTGSGKTGLGVSLIEEAIMDDIPSIIIDPKGDLANMALTFPKLSAREFRPWINEGTARQKGVTPDEFASTCQETPDAEHLVRRFVEEVFG